MRRLTTFALAAAALVLAACAKKAEQPAATDSAAPDTTAQAPDTTTPTMVGSARPAPRLTARYDTANVTVSCGADAPSTEVSVDVDTVKVKVGRRVVWPVAASGAYDSVVIAPKERDSWPFAGRKPFAGTTLVQSLPVRGPKNRDYLYMITAYCGGPKGFSKVLDPDIYVD